MRRHPLLIFILAIIAAWSVFLVFVPSQTIVDYIGIENTYIAAFLLAAIGGISTLTSASFFTAIATFAAGGASPLLLGLFGGVGAFFSNTLLYFLLVYGKRTLTQKWKAFVDRLGKKLEQLPVPLVLLGVFIYSGFTPFPDDILLAVLAISSYTYPRFAPFLFAGNLTIVMLVAYLAQRGVALF
jgi:hypothetical protein